MRRKTWIVACVVALVSGGGVFLAGSYLVLAVVVGGVWGATVPVVGRLAGEDSRLLTGRGLSDGPRFEFLVPTVGANAGALLGVGLAPIPDGLRLGLGVLVLGVGFAGYAAGTLTGVSFGRRLDEE